MVREYILFVKCFVFIYASNVLQQSYEINFDTIFALVEICLRSEIYAFNAFNIKNSYIGHR